MTSGQIPDAHIRWISRHALLHEKALRTWLSARRLPGLEVDNIVQETYVRLLRTRDLHAVRNPRAYLFQTAWSVLATHLRRERVIAIQALADVAHLGLRADSPTPEKEAADRDELHRLGEAIASLPGKLGEVFRLRRVQGLSQREVAQTLGLAESTVEKHMSRGLLLLMARFTRGGNAGPEASKRPDASIERSEKRRGRTQH